MPPIISFTKVFALIIAYIAPSNNNLLNKSFCSKFKENTITKIKLTKICKNSSDKYALSHALKNHLVLCKNNDKKAKGANKVKIFIIIYLSEYVKIKFNKPIDKIAFKIPDKENILSDVLFILITEFNSCIRVEKQISLLNKFSPIFLIARDILDISSIRHSQMNGEKFSRIENTITLKIKVVGLIF